MRFSARSPQEAAWWASASPREKLAYFLGTQRGLGQAWPSEESLRRLETRFGVNELEAAESVRQQRTGASRSTAKYRGAHPEPGLRRCARCREVFPEAVFPMKDAKKGTRRSYCDDCWKQRQRERYVTVDRERLLNSVGITMTVIDGDNLLGLACAGCGRPLVVGDEVHAPNVELRHVDCLAAAERRAS